MAAGRICPGRFLAALAFSLAAGCASARADGAEKALAKSYSDFGARILATLAHRPGNVMVSPYSIGVAMSMAAAGARGDTRTEMQRTLHLPDDGSEAAADRRLAGKLAEYGRRDPKPTIVRTANGLAIPGFGQAVISKPYVAAMQRDYSAEILPDATVAGINGWVNRKTDGRIPSLIDALPPTTAAVLLNAVAFEAKWASEFDKKDTADLPFTLRSGEQIRAPRMNQTAYLRLADGDGFKALQLAYGTREIEMVVVLPDKGKPVDTVLAGLLKGEAAALFGRLGDAAPQRVEVGLPRIEMRSRNSLRPAIEAAGIRRAFEPGRADFSGMIDPSAAGQRFFIDDVVHEAMIRADESGTVAAAATGVVTRSVSAMPVTKPPVPFVVDRPFAFFIVERTSGAVLFEGRIDDPRG